MKIKIRGIEFDVPDQAAQALEAERKDAAEAHEKLAAEVKTATAAAESTKAKLDSATAELEKEKKARKDAEDPKAMQEKIAARVALEKSVAPVFRDDEDLDLAALTDKEIKVKALAKLGVKVDGKPDAYVDARFDAEIEKLDVDGDAITDARVAAEGREDDDDGEEHEDAEDRPVKGGSKKPMNAKEAFEANRLRMANAWKDTAKKKAS